jgi:hypothetical protein
MNLPVIRLGKPAAQAMEKKPFTQVGQFHRFGKALRWCHLPQHIDVPASLWIGFKIHGKNCMRSRWESRKRCISYVPATDR